MSFRQVKANEQTFSYDDGVERKIFQNMRRNHDDQPDDDDYFAFHFASVVSEMKAMLSIALSSIAV